MRILLLTSALLAIVGMLSSICGIVEEEWKPAASGLVLLLGSGVFARLHAGGRGLLGRSLRE
jgi:hypothetical protein